MSYLAFHSRNSTIRLSGPEVHHISWLAKDALASELSHPCAWQLRTDLQLPPPGSMFFGSQLFMLMSDGEAHRVQGQDVYVMDLALNVLYDHHPAAGILCWLYDHALIHGWIAEADRHAFAGEIQAALDAGSARPRMADRSAVPLAIGGCPLPAGGRGGWEEVTSFLRAATGDVVTSLSIGSEFPHRQLALEAGTWRASIANPDAPEEQLEELWDQLGDSEQWDVCTQALRTRPSLQWQPGGQGYVFGDFTIRQSAGLVPVRPG